MEGRTHLFCTGMFVFAGLFAIFKMGHIGVADAAFLFFASLIGALLPDVDALHSLATKIKLRGPGEYFAYFVRFIALVTKYLLFSALGILLFISGRKGAKHRGIMHSFKGLVLVGLFWLIAGWLFLEYFRLGKYFPALSFSIIGLVFGYLMHLWHDGLTIGGVELMGGLKFSGWLRTGKHEWMLQLFFLISCAFSAHISNAISPLYGLAILLLALPASFLLFGR
ncbi:MAG: metal-dependent hydrolase [Candidatus Micrarchaeota archaeon]